MMLPMSTPELRAFRVEFPGLDVSGLLAYYQPPDVGPPVRIVANHGGLNVNDRHAWFDFSDSSTRDRIARWMSAQFGPSKKRLTAPMFFWNELGGCIHWDLGDVGAWCASEDSARRYHSAYLPTLAGLLPATQPTVADGCSLMEVLAFRRIATEIARQARQRILDSRAVEYPDVCAVGPEDFRGTDEGSHYMASKQGLGEDYGRRRS
jgi:hypothetical protein